jgi:hypothetical protein
MSYEDKIKRQAEPFLEPGEQVLAAIIAQPRGMTRARAGGLGPSAIGGRKVKQQRAAAESTGLELTSPMALAVTGSRLVVLGISAPIAMGKGGDVKGFVSAVPLAEVDSIEVKRLPVGKVVIVSVRGVAMKLEAGAGADAKGLALAFEQASAVVS